MELNESRIVPVASPPKRARHLVLLWFGLLGGALAWTLRLAVAYALNPVACATGWTILIHLVTLVTALITLAAIVVAFRGWRTSGLGTRTEVGGPAGWSGFLSLLGVLLNLVFLLAILLEGSAAFVIGPCAVGP